MVGFAGSSAGSAGFGRTVDCVGVGFFGRADAGVDLSFFAWESGVGAIIDERDRGDAGVGSADDVDFAGQLDHRVRHHGYFRVGAVSQRPHGDA